MEGEVVFSVINVSDSVTKSQVRQRARLPLLALRRATSCEHSGRWAALLLGAAMLLPLSAFTAATWPPRPAAMFVLRFQQWIFRLKTLYKLDSIFRDTVTCLPAHTEQGFAKVADVRKIFSKSGSIVTLLPPTHQQGSRNNQGRQMNR